MSVAQAQEFVTETAAAVACSHCGLPVPASRVVKGAGEQFCCAGCEAVYRIIHECRLDDFYRLRDEFGDDHKQAARVSGKSFDYLDDPEYLKRYAEPLTAGGLRVRFYLDGVHCIACSWLTEKVLMEREGARFARLDLGRSILEVVFNPAEVKLSRLALSLDRLGYTPHALWEGSGAAAQRKETRSLLARLGIAAASAMNIMLLAVSQYAGDVSGIESGISALFRWVSLGLALPAVLYSAWPYYRGAWSGLRRGMLHMDLPISLGILAAFSMSAAATVLNRGEVYFDSVSALIALLLAGRLLLQRAGRWAADAGENLLSLSPRTARRIEDDRERDVLLTEIHVGDRLRVLPGETIPVDGTLSSGEGWIAEAHLSGEPGAAHRSPRDSLFAGSVVEQSPIVMAATAVGETTRLARLAEIMRNASVRRAPIVSLLNRVAAWFVAAVLTLAAATAVIWLFVDPSRALWNAAAVLVVACPCALGLATPVALAVAMGRAARRGIFIKGQDGVERLASTEHVILDKTGTLTEGNLSIVERHFADRVADCERVEILRAVAALEKFSGHVIATAFRDVPGNGVILKECRVLPGAGVEGRVDGHHVCAGSESFIAERVTELPAELSARAADAERRGVTVVWVARDHEACALLTLGDSLRNDAALAVGDMRKLGLDLELLSGDHEQAVARVARELSIADFRGRVSPEQKLSRVEELAAQGKRTAMVGDGVNDAAALGRAHVGISAAGAADVARDAADVFISSTREPSAIAEAFALSRRAMRVVRVNLWIAVAYNLVGAALAVTGHVSPLVAAVLMPLSSLTVLLIAARA